MKKLCITALIACLAGSALASDNGSFTNSDECVSSLQQYAKEVKDKQKDATPDNIFDLLAYSSWFETADRTAASSVSHSQECNNGQCVETTNYNLVSACGVLKLSNQLFSNASLYNDNHLPEYVGNEIRYWKNYNAGNTSSKSYAARKYAYYNIVCTKSATGDSCKVSVAD